MSKPSQFQDWPESLDVPYGPYRAVIERVVDGDTVHVIASLGLDEYAYRMIRIRGAFAPELFSGPPNERERGKAARDLLDGLLPVGTKCRLTTECDITTFGRYVARKFLLKQRNREEIRTRNAALRLLNLGRSWFKSAGFCV